jgi:hypothetical protein
MEIVQAHDNVRRCSMNRIFPDGWIEGWEIKNDTHLEKDNGFIDGIDDQD